MLIRILFLAIFSFFALILFAQKPTCKSLQRGNFKVVSQDAGTTFIKRTDKEQIEKNEALGYEIIFSIKWLDECTYVLRPKKLIKGDPSIMGDGTHFVKTKIKEISNKTYVAETSASFSDQVVDFVVDILN